MSLVGMCELACTFFRMYQRKQKCKRKQKCTNDDDPSEGKLGFATVTRNVRLVLNEAVFFSTSSFVLLEALTGV